MRKFWGAIIPSLLAVVMFGCAVFLFILPATEQALLKKKQDTIRETTQVVLSFLSTYASQAEQGVLSLQEAQQRAKQRIRELRYGKDRKDYFWVINKEVRPLAHPYYPLHEGRDGNKITDAKGNFFLAEMVYKAYRDGEAFVSYYWQWKDDPNRIEKKLSYVRYFEPWDWVVGTGVYLDDVRAELRQLTRYLTFIGLSVVLFALLIAVYIAKRQFKTDQERVKALRALRETSQEYQAVLQASPNPIIVYDKTGRVVYLSPSFTSYFGWGLNELIGQEIKYVPPGEQTKTKDAIKQLYTGEKDIINLETIRYKKDGGTLNVNISTAVFRDSDGKPKGLVVCLTDISHIKQTEKALRASESLFRTLAENSLDIIMRFDPEGRHLYVNPAAEKKSGFKAHDFIGKTHREIGFPEDLCVLWDDAIKEVFHTKEPNRIEFQLPTGFWIDWLLFPEFDEDGEVKAVLTSARDISERKNAEQQQRKMEAHMLQTRKLEALGTLAGGIAHDFNNILGGISGYTELAIMKLPSDSPAKANMNKVLTACERAKDLIKQILTFSRKSDKEDIGPVSVNVIVKEVKKLLRAALPMNVAMETELEHHGDVIANATHIHQMLMNLGANAGHAMKDNDGTLKIKTSSVLIDSQNLNSYPGLQAGNHILIQVSDNGDGIDPQILDKIFDPFFSTKGSAGGTGLGLAVVHGIVTKYNGLITVDSEKGKGTTFNILLPCAAEETVTEPDQLPEALVRGNESVLLVDDEKDLLDVITQWLEMLGYSVTASASPLEALSLFAKDPARFDLLISDLAMPGKNGFELAEAVFAIRPDLPIMIVSGQVSAGQQNRAKSLGINMVLQKPLFLKDLGLRIREILDQTGGSANQNHASPDSRSDDPGWHPPGSSLVH